MSSCGIAVIVQNDTKQLYSTSERGYLMDALMLWGPNSALNELDTGNNMNPETPKGSSRIPTSTAAAASISIRATLRSSLMEDGKATYSGSIPI